MNKLQRTCLLAAMLAAQTLPAYAYIDWDWPMGMIQSDPKEIDKASTAYAGGDVDSAITILNNIKARQGEDCRVRHILADIYKEQKRYTEAKSELQDLAGVESKYISKNPMNFPGWMDPHALKLDMGNVCMTEGQYQEALGYFREAAQLKPSSLEPKKYTAMCYERMGELDQAYNTYKSTLDSSGAAMKAGDKSFFAEAVARLDKTMNEKGAQPTQAVASAHDTGGPVRGGVPGPGSSSVNAQSPGSFGQASRPVVATHTLGTGPLQDATNDIGSRKYDAAIARLKPIVEKSPSNAQAHYLLAVAYASTSKYELARQEYEATLKYAQDMKLLKLASAGLTKIQGKQ